MRSRRIWVSEDLYGRVRSANRPNETLGETVERLVDGYSLTTFADDADDLDLAFSVADATDRTSVTPPSADE